jgi:hypothetical protein
VCYERIPCIAPFPNTVFTLQKPRPLWPAVQPPKWAQLSRRVAKNCPDRVTPTSSTNGLRAAVNRHLLTWVRTAKADGLRQWCFRFVWSADQQIDGPEALRSKAEGMHISARGLCSSSSGAASVMAEADGHRTEGPAIGPMLKWL